MPNGENGEGEAEPDRGDAGATPFPFALLLMLSLREQKPSLLCAIPAVTGGIWGVEKPAVGDGSLR